jgi:hypothetical protein
MVYVITLAYGLILLVVAVVLAARHQAYPHASERSKRWVWSLVAASLAICFALPSLMLVGVLLQVGVCVYVILHQTVCDEMAKW